MDFKEEISVNEFSVFAEGGKGECVSVGREWRIEEREGVLQLF